MRHQLRAPAERLPTVITLEGLLAGVSPLVLREGDLLAEGLPTLLALIGLFPSVNPLV